jgi:hypothetical protein
MPLLDPIISTLEVMRDRLGDGPVHGLVPGLVVDDRAGWTPATRYTDEAALPNLITAAQRRWRASPHAAAALAWKSYTYWVTLPAVLGFATGRVPDVSAGNVLVRLHVGPPFLEVGLSRPTVAVANGDPLAGRPGVTVVDDLAGYLRDRLLDGHLSPVLDGLHDLVRLGRRTLLGSVASAVGHALVRYGSTRPDPAAIRPVADALLSALGVADLVEITPELTVRRQTCCLAFSLPEPKICRGCCLPQSAALSRPH